MFFVIKKKSIVITLIFVFFVSFCVSINMTYKDRIISVMSTAKPLPIYNVDTDKKEIALGINCAWGNEDIDDFIKLLDKHNAKATFFILGQWAEKNSDCVQKLSKNGHEIASHSYDHTSLDKVSKEVITKEVKKSMDVLESITRDKPKLFRFPSGAYNDMAVNTVNSLGYKCIQWDVDSRDWLNPSASEIKEKVIKNAKCGSILLFHTSKENSLTALKEIIPELMSQGYEFVTVSDMIYDEDYYIDNNGTQHECN